MRLVNVSDLNEIFGISGSDWMEVEETTPERVKIPPSNPDTLKNWHLNKDSGEELARSQSISETYLSMSEEQWRELNTHRLKGNPQRIEIKFDGKEFLSQNAAARYAMKKYGVSRNTAIRYIKENRPIDKRKQSNREYGGDYQAVKYDA